MYRGNSKSEHVTRSRTSTTSNDVMSTTSNPKSRWVRLKRSHSDDGTTPKVVAVKDEHDRKRVGKKGQSQIDNMSLEGRQSIANSWFRKQYNSNERATNADTLPDHKSLSENSKKSTGGIFQRSWNLNPRKSSTDHQKENIIMNKVGRNSDTNCDYKNIPVFYDDDDKDCVSSFADDYDSQHKSNEPILFSIFRNKSSGVRSTKLVTTGNNPSSNTEPTLIDPKLQLSSNDDTTMKRSEMAPLRKNVSFEYDNSSHVNDQHLVIKKIVPRSQCDSTEGMPNTFVENDYGYNTIDFPIPKNVENDYGYNTIDFPIPKKTPSALSSTVETTAKVSARERARYSVYQGNSKVKKKLRVRPYHCFPDETVMMTEEEIYAESLNKSKEFVPLKSYLAPSTKRSSDLAVIPDSIREMWGTPETDGRIGSLRVEVLGCVGLNRTKPDICLYIVCGDSAFCTDVITGYRSPMWPSVSRRACIIPIHHAYAKLFIGVFDVKKRTNKENDVFCGRVAIDIACIRPNTEYDTTLPLRASTFVYDKRKRGVVRVRFSIHWFSERAAATSYLKPAKSLLDSCPLVDGQPTIPCADPKTFRNVAVTVYGQDLPGKYSKNAFRATVRELTLYQQNLRVVCKVLILDAMLYEEPWISAYLFVSAIYCVFYNTVAMVPALTVGYIIILYVENYRRYVENNDFHFGYKPLTILEVFKAVFFNKERNLKESFYHSIDVEKKTKRRHGDRGASLKHENEVDMNDETGDLVPMDHREFPFSDRDAYPKFSVEESIAPGSNKGGTGRLHGRLSVYYTTELPTSSDNADEDDSDRDSDRDDETVMTESQMLGDSLYDLDSDHDDEDYEMNLEGTDYNYKLAMTAKPKGGAYDRRLRIGPPQDTDLSGGNKIPPQVQLKKVEALLHKFSRSISVEMVHAPPISEKTDTVDSAAPSGMTAPSRELQDKMTKKAKKLMYDEFDKLLGLHSRNANPVHRIMSSFMGPLMRMIRVVIFLVRISFNVSTWRDPYLSFWVLMMLCSLCFILIFFPWRAFFLVASVICLGPQNIFVRKYLERKIDAKAAEEKSSDSEAINPSAQQEKASSGNVDNGKISVDTTSQNKEKNEDNNEVDVRRGFFAKRRNHAVEVRPVTSQRQKGSTSNKVPDCEHLSRPAFYSGLHGQATSSTKLQPRAVAIPYSRFKKERFYDWPPDPTVSRATPIILQTDIVEKDDSLSASVLDVPISDHEEDDVLDLSLRQHHASESKPSSGIPEFIVF